MSLKKLFKNKAESGLNKAPSQQINVSSSFDVESFDAIKQKADFDKKIFALLCSDEGYPNDTLIAERRVREDWTVTSVFFPSQGILWITETEW